MMFIPETFLGNRYPKNIVNIVWSIVYFKVLSELLLATCCVRYLHAMSFLRNMKLFFSKNFQNHMLFRVDIAFQMT